MVSYLMTTINRLDVTPEVTAKNILNANYPISEILITDNGSSQKDMIVWGMKAADIFTHNETNIGNPQSFNRMLQRCQGDYIVIAGNDIQLPKDWLKKAVELAKDPKVGLVGFDWRDEPRKETYKTMKLTQGCPFGTWVFHRRLLDDVGYFNEWSKYGLWDSAYALRCKAKGLLNGYVLNAPSKHVGADVGENSDYRRMKNEEMNKAKPHYSKLIKELAINK